MSDLVAINYNECYARSFKVRGDNIEFTDGCRLLSDRLHYRNKLFVLNKKGTGGIHFYIYGDPFNAIDRIIEDCNSNPYPGDTLYISKECKIPRELIRKSGYKITIDKDKADYIVVPYKRNFSSFGFDVVAKKDGDIYLFLCANGRETFRSNKIDKDEIVKHFENLGYSDVVTSSDVSDNEAFFIPNFDIYKEIINEPNSNRKYIYEHQLKVQPPIEVSLDTLNVWKNITDDNMRAKLISSSDCLRYPVTMMYFMHKFWWSYMLGIKDPVVNRMLDIIKYDKNASLRRNMFTERVIQPEDWNLLTKFILNNLGASETGGFIAESQYSNLDELEKNVIRYRMCVAPFYINEPMESEIILKIKE